MLRPRAISLACAVLVAIFSNALAKSRQESKQGKPEHSEQQPKTEQRGTEEAPFIVKIQEAPQTQTKPDANAGNGQNQRSNGWFFGWLDGWTLSDKIAGIASVAAFLQFIALVATIAVMIRNGRHQLRAYVTIISGSLTIQNKTFCGILDLKNSGQTPAYEVAILAQMNPQESVKSFVEVARDESVALPKMIIGPGSTTNSRCKLEFLNDPDVVTSLLRDDQNTVYIWGRIDYRDIFKCKRWVEFRLRSHYVKAEGRFVFAGTPDGNRAK